MPTRGEASPVNLKCIPAMGQPDTRHNVLSINTGDFETNFVSEEFAFTPCAGVRLENIKGGAHG